MYGDGIRVESANNGRPITRKDPIPKVNGAATKQPNDQVGKPAPTASGQPAKPGTAASDRQLLNYGNGLTVDGANLTEVQTFRQYVTVDNLSTVQVKSPKQPIWSAYHLVKKMRLFEIRLGYRQNCSMCGCYNYARVVRQLSPQEAVTDEQAADISAKLPAITAEMRD